MDLLLAFLLSSAVLVQGYGKSNVESIDPNDEPFLPIYPVYPYSPKLIKRGAEKESVTQLSSVLYAPKDDAKDSYSASFSGNHPRDPYYPNYNPYPKVSSPSSYAYYNTLPYSYPTTPYNAYSSYSSPYTLPPPSYTAIPYSSSYPNYYYQPSYYHPNYYSQPPYPPLPLPPPATDYPTDPYSQSEPTGDAKEKKPIGDNKHKDNNVNQLVDEANYISESQKDLDGQPSTYETSSPQNQLEQTNDLRIKNFQVPLPKTTYRVISVAGQPVGPDYPLPASYARAQQLEELISHAWVKLLAQNLQYPVSETNKNTVTRTNDDRSKDTRFVSVPNTIAKPGPTYLLNPSLLGKLNVEQTTDEIINTPTTRLKNIKYSSLNPGVYTAIEKPEKYQTESNEYENYENSSSQGIHDYDSSLSQVDKQQQNYESDSGQTYQNQNYVTAQTPRGYNYRYTSYNPSQTIAQQQSQRYKNNLEEMNFGAKTKKA